jgi:hypothetical protein
LCLILLKTERFLLNLAKRLENFVKYSPLLRNLQIKILSDHRIVATDPDQRSDLHYSWVGAESFDETGSSVFDFNATSVFVVNEISGDVFVVGQVTIVENFFVVVVGGGGGGGSGSRADDKLARVFALS